MGLGSRAGIFAAAGLFIGLGSLATPPSEAAADQRQSREPLCRRAAPLPALPPESELRQDQQASGRGRSEGALTAETTAPPSPPPHASAAEDEAGSVVVTGTRIARPSMDSPVAITTVTGDDVGERRGGEPVAGVRGRPPRAEPQSGQLTAGDHDDLLNPLLYAHYVRSMLGKQAVSDVPRVDTRRVLTVRVQDESGRPVPFADVKLTCADGNTLTLATVADGTAVFFPELDRLGTRVRVTADGVTQGDSRSVSFGPAGAQEQTLTVSRRAPAVRRLDLMVVLDTTGSMQDEIDYLKSELRAILDELARAHGGLDIRLGLVAYRDEGDVYVTRTYGFTGDLDRMQENLRAQNANGGGDMPEAMDQALARAMAADWRPDAVRAMLLVADAPPHAENVAKTWSIAEAARARRIQIVPVAASGVDDLAQYVMRAMAAATQSRYLFLTDDSGIGNPHAEPSVDCYRVTRLDALVRRVLDSLVSGRRVEARESEIIRTVGTYDQGRCVLPRNFRVDD